MLMRLMYASEATAAFGPGELDALLAGARRANERRELTGLLVFDHRAFLQVLEGEGERLSELFCRIAADPRHRRVLVLEACAVDERVFADWSMGFAAADAAGTAQFLRFGGRAGFDPHALSAASALGLLRTLRGRASGTAA
jgi:hypothetical protein